MKTSQINVSSNEANISVSSNGQPPKSNFQPGPFSEDDEDDLDLSLDDNLDSIEDLDLDEDDDF